MFAIIDGVMARAIKQPIIACENAWHTLGICGFLPKFSMITAAISGPNIKAAGKCASCSNAENAAEIVSKDAQRIPTLLNKSFNRFSENHLAHLH